MDIKIEAPGHPSQDLVKEHYSNRLTKKYGQYDFIKAIDVKITKVDESMKAVSLQLKPEKGTMLFVKGVAERENVALNNAIRKMNVKIEKYKEKHYHNVHRVSKPQIKENNKN